MQEQAKKFIDVLESEGLLSPEIVDELRRQVRESKTRLKPELLAKLLVDNGHLTKFQATKLVTELKDSDPPADESAPAGHDEDELGFAEDAEQSATKSNVATVILDDEPAEDEPIETVPVIESVDSDANVAVMQAVESVPGDEKVEAIPAGSLADEDEDSSGFGDVPAPATRTVTKKVSKDNPWDSFRILGVGLLLGLVCVLGYFLVNHFMRGNADQVLERAEEAYEQRSYETAAAIYDDFAKTWTAHEQASFARVRAAIAKIRNHAEGAPDPTIGLETALGVLPGISSEPGLNEQRSDLAGVLISLAGKFNDRADGQTETADRKALMGEMEKLLVLIDDPKFVGQAQRNQYAPTLEKIQENRSRILREINRDEQLAESLQQIDELLGAKDTTGAYQVRDNLIGLYPLLEANDGLKQRVLQASEIERSLVAAGQLNPSLSAQEPVENSLKEFLLSHSTGETVGSLAGKTTCFNVKGAVFGVDAGSGRLLWSKYVGRGFETSALPIENSNDFLICNPGQGRLTRVEGQTGKAIWHVDFGEEIHQPVAEGQDLFVTSHRGEVASLDMGSGQLIWSKRLPQAIAVSPGLAFGQPYLYVAADHTNLFVLSRQDGTCREVMYTGHMSGAIRVAPIVLLGQLFVFENLSTDKARVRILDLTEGLALTESEIPVPVDGNIVVDPQIDGRRLVVLSDLGALVALDIEPSAESDKVSVIASRAKNVLSPQMSWLVAESNHLWVADTRLSRLELQVTMERIDGRWSRHDGDTFIGKPQKWGDVIISARILRGNQGVRITASNADSGDGLWSTDVGVPVSWMQRRGGQVEALNTSAQKFTVSDTPLQLEAESNPGQDKALLDFRWPVPLDGESAAIFNATKTNQFLRVADGSLRILSANFGGANAASEPVAVGDNVALGLDNGQFILIDSSNGALAASPYSPPLEPGKKVKWNTPVYLQDANLIFIANDQQKLSRLSVGSSLRALTEVDLETPLVGPLASTGAALVATDWTQAGDRLIFFDPTSLQMQSNVPLNGRVIAGPFGIEQGIVVQTDSELHLFAANGERKWSIEFVDSKLVAPPSQSDGDLLLATRSGELWQVALADGRVAGKLTVARQFSCAPLVVSRGVLIGTDEGSVLALPMPDSPEAAEMSGSR